MNSLQQQIETIRKSIEDKTGKPCEITYNKSFAEISWWDPINMMFKLDTIDTYLFSIIPLSPNKEGWIPDIIELEKERLAWSLETFTDATPVSSLRKLESEIKEIEQDIEGGICNPEEFADALMCLFDSAGRHKIAVEEIFQAFKEKLAKNKARVWKKNPDNSYSHIPTRNTCQTCGKEITGSGYCSKECSNEGFKKDKI